ncbi:SDR family oxidoreductase [Agrobacterium rosae]
MHVVPAIHRSEYKLVEAVQPHRSPASIENMKVSIPLGRLGSPKDVANAFLFLVPDDASYIASTTMAVDGWQLLLKGADFQLLPS